MPFETSFARFQFRKSFQVVSRHLQNLKNDCFTIVKPLFSELHSSHKVASLGLLLGAFWHHFRSHCLPNAAQSAKKGPFKKQPKIDQILGPKLTPK